MHRDVLNSNTSVHPTEGTSHHARSGSTATFWASCHFRTTAPQCRAAGELISTRLLTPSFFDPSNKHGHPFSVVEPCRTVELRRKGR